MASKKETIKPKAKGLDIKGLDFGFGNEDFNAFANEKEKTVEFSGDLDIDLGLETKSKKTTIFVNAETKAKLEYIKKTGNKVNLSKLTAYAVDEYYRKVRRKEGM